VTAFQFAEAERHLAESLADYHAGTGATATAPDRKTKPQATGESAMSKVGTLTAFLKGQHVMGDAAPGAGLRDYHAAKACVNAGRKRDLQDRFNAVRAKLKNYRVTVAIWQGDVSVRRTVDADGNALACPQSWMLKS
jgi:hypothetical protein